MFLDPDKLAETAPVDVLDAASRGHIGLDHRFLHSLIDRPSESLAAVVAFSKRDRGKDAVDLAPELLALFRYWKDPGGVPFLIDLIQEDPENIPDEAIETLVEIGEPALNQLLALYEKLDEAQSGEVAFILANLKVRDDRILKTLTDRLEFDLADTALLLGIYGDPRAIAALEAARSGSGEQDRALDEEIADAIEQLQKPTGSSPDEESFDIWMLYPEKYDLPVDILDEDERTELLNHPVASVRAAAVQSFFNRELTADQRKKVLYAATQDPAPEVRAGAWEALIDSTELPEVIEAMLAALRNDQLGVEERGGLLVGLSAETDRNEVRKAIVSLYESPGGRAKALEAMWRSMHKSFRDYFPKHLDDPDIEVRRGAVWGVGYYSIKSELERIRKLFDNEDLRSDALFAYALAVPAELSRGRMKGLLARIERDAHGLAEREEELVKVALDERLVLAGKEPVFSQQED